MALVVTAEAPAPLALVDAEPATLLEDDSDRKQRLLETRLEKDEIATRAGAGSKPIPYMESWRVIEKVRGPSSAARPVVHTALTAPCFLESRPSRSSASMGGQARSKPC